MEEIYLTVRDIKNHETQEECNIDVMEYFDKNQEYLESNHFNLDLFPEQVGYNMDLFHLLDAPVYLMYFCRSKYEIEIRENRFLTILVKSFTELKNDYKLWKK